MHIRSLTEGCHFSLVGSADPTANPTVSSIFQSQAIKASSISRFGGMRVSNRVKNGLALRSLGSVRQRPAFLALLVCALLVGCLEGDDDPGDEPSNAALTISIELDRRLAVHTCLVGVAGHPFCRVCYDSRQGNAVVQDALSAAGR